MTNQILCLPLLLTLVACGANPPPQADPGGTGGGSGQQSGPPSTGGAYPGSSEINPSTGTGGSPGAGCTGDLDAVGAVWGVACPPTFCEAQAMVSNCASLPQNVARVSINSNLWTGLVKFELSGAQRKGCVYSGNELTGDLAWDDVASFCNGTSTSIVAGTAGTYSAYWSTQFPQVCDSTNLKGVARGSDEDAGVVPPASCFTIYGCLPCCSDPLPDCTNKPNGYPGYSCAPGGDYCSCQCSSGKWYCGC
jgi:hypothetical protein